MCPECGSGDVSRNGTVLRMRTSFRGEAALETATINTYPTAQMCAYEAQRNGGVYVEVEIDDTTQQCSKCDRMHSPPLTLKDRVYSCPCGHTEYRDVNASANILGRALNAVGQGMPALTRVERIASTFHKGRRVVSKKREPPEAAGVAS